MDSSEKHPFCANAMDCRWKSFVKEREVFRDQDPFDREVAAGFQPVFFYIYNYSRIYFFSS